MRRSARLSSPLKKRSSSTVGTPSARTTNGNHHAAAIPLGDSSPTLSTTTSSGRPSPNGNGNLGYYRRRNRWSWTNRGKIRLGRRGFFSRLQLVYLSLIMCGMGFFLSLVFTLRRGEGLRDRRVSHQHKTILSLSTTTTNTDNILSPTFLESFPDAPSSCNTPLSHTDISYTLVTQCSQDRLWMMKYHCQRWGRTNPISIGVYTNQTIAEINATLRDEYQCDTNYISIQIVPMIYSKEDFPVNILRNLAMANVQTTHAVYVDSDFWQDVQLHDKLTNPVVTRHLAYNAKHALVLPAFALRRQCREYRDCQSRNLQRMPLTANDILQGLTVNHTVTAFDPTNYGGHGSTRYSDWIDNVMNETQDNDSVPLMPIDCVISNRYEPYLVVRYCQELPPFQPVFTGYGKNKMTWVMQLRRLGYYLHQLNSFVIHYPHLDSSARVAWNNNNNANHDEQQQQLAQTPPMARPKGKHVDYLQYKRGRNDYAFVQFKNWLDTTVGVDRTVVDLCDDHMDDDGNLWIHHQEEEEEEEESSQPENDEEADDYDETESDEVGEGESSGLSINGSNND